MNAHRALDDARETAQIFEKMQDQLQCDAELCQRMLTPATLQYKAKRQTPATQHQIKRLKEYMEAHEIQDDIDWDNLTRSQASRIQDQYYAAYGR